MLEALVADARERLRFPREHRRYEARGLHLRESGLESEKIEDRKHEAPPRSEVPRGAGDDAVEQRPTVEATVVRRGLRILAIGARRVRHLRRVGADEIEALACDRRIAVAQPC